MKLNQLGILLILFSSVSAFSQESKILLSKSDMDSVRMEGRGDLGWLSTFGIELGEMCGEIIFNKIAIHPGQRNIEIWGRSQYELGPLPSSIKIAKYNYGDCENIKTVIAQDNGEFYLQSDIQEGCFLYGEMMGFYFPLYNIERLVLGTNTLENEIFIREIKVYSSIEDGLGDPLHVYRLNLSNQPLSIHDPKIVEFKNLEHLNLNSNNISVLPGSVIHLKNLEELSIENNLFQEIPCEVKKLMKLKWVYIKGNPIALTNPPRWTRGYTYKLYY